MKKAILNLMLIPFLFASCTDEAINDVDVDTRGIEVTVGEKVDIIGEDYPVVHTTDIYFVKFPDPSKHYTITSIKWEINGKTVSEQEFLEYRFNQEGVHNIKCTGTYFDKGWNTVFNGERKITVRPYPGREPYYPLTIIPEFISESSTDPVFLRMTFEPISYFDHTGGYDKYLPISRGGVMMLCRVRNERNEPFTLGSRSLKITVTSIDGTRGEIDYRLHDKNKMQVPSLVVPSKTSTYMYINIYNVIAAEEGHLRNDDFEPGYRWWMETQFNFYTSNTPYPYTVYDDIIRLEYVRY